MLRLLPQVKFIILDKTYRVYSSVGAVIGFGSIYKETRSNNNSSSSSKKYKYSNGLSFGLNTAFGIEYKTSSNIALFLEVDLYTQSFGPRKRTLQSSFKNGINDLPNLSTSEIVTEYEDNYTNLRGSTPTLMNPIKNYVIFIRSAL